MNFKNNITVKVRLMAQTQTRDKRTYDVYLIFRIAHQGRLLYNIKLLTGKAVPICDWSHAKQKVTGTNKTATQWNDQLAEMLYKSNEQLKMLAIKPLTCEQIRDEINNIIRTSITGKAPKGKSIEFHSSSKEATYDYVMARLISKGGICKAKQNSYNSGLALLTKFYKGKLPTVDKISSQKLEEFNEWLMVQQYLKKGVLTYYANDTLTTYKSSIGSVIKHAMKLNIITSNPLPACFRGNWVKDSKKDRLNESEMYKFINQDESKLTPTEIIYKVAGTVQMLTSLGRTDFANLQYSNFKEYQYLTDDMETVTKHYIEGQRGKKGKVTFTIFTPPVIKNHIDRLIQLIGSEARPFNFHSETTMNNVYKKLTELAGIRKAITSNNFRHSLATDWCEKGCDTSVLDRIMGHADDTHKMTRRYAKITEKRQSEEMEKYISRCKIHRGPLQPDTNKIIEHRPAMLKAV